MRSLVLILAAVATTAFALGSAKADIVSGNIAVYGPGGTLLGYVSDTYDGQNSFTYTTNLAGALSVDVNTSASAPFALLMTNPPGSYDYLGAVGGTGGSDFSSSSQDYSYFSGSALTAAGAKAASAGNDIQSLGYRGPAESSIWSLSGDVLSAQWVNANGSVDSNTTFFYDPIVKYIGMTGNLADYNNVYGDGAKAVTLEFTGALAPPPPATPEPSSIVLMLTGLAGAAGVARRKLRR